jgi:hypothetical protein
MEWTSQPEMAAYIAGTFVQNFVFSATAVNEFTLCDLLLVDTFMITLI